MEEVNCVIPSSIVLKATPYGEGIFTTVAFNVGDELYQQRWLDVTIPTDGSQSMPITSMTVNGERYPIDLHKHSIATFNGKRQFYYFDSFMNHSCDPNTFSTEILFDETGGVLRTVARKPIAAGEQLTCDYDLLDWDCDGDGNEVPIESCECGAESCRGFIHGFKYIQPELQKVMIAYASKSVQQYFSKSI